MFQLRLNTYFVHLPVDVIDADSLVHIQDPLYLQELARVLKGTPERSVFPIIKGRRGGGGGRKVGLGFVVVRKTHPLETIVLVTSVRLPAGGM